ncbi:TetR/AcrR family transcriptional regulator [Catellatospora coxensis]
MRELLREVGYDKMTMDAIAARAHMSKATLYRHWPGKPDLVAQVLRQQQTEDVAPADTGSLRGDLIELLATAARCVVDEGPLIHALSFEMQSNPELAGIVRGQVYPEIHRHTEALLERAVQRGEIKPQPYDSLFPDLVTAQLMARHLDTAGRSTTSTWPGSATRSSCPSWPAETPSPPKGTTMTTTVSRPEAAEPSAAAPNPGAGWR